MGKSTWRNVGLMLALALATAGCDRLGGLAPLSLGGDAPAGGGSITVNHGDSLYLISRRYDVPLRDLIDANHLKPPYNIEPGQRLLLPRARQYIVRSGDTLYGVSRMFSVDVSELTRLNNLTPPYNIRAGQPLRLPSPTAGAGPDNQPTVAAAPRSKIERSDMAALPSPSSPAPAAAAPFNPAAPSVTYQGGQEPKSLRPQTLSPPPALAAPSPAVATPAAPPQTLVPPPATADNPPPVAQTLAVPGRKPMGDSKPADNNNRPPEARPPAESPAEPVTVAAAAPPPAVKPRQSPPSAAPAVAAPPPPAHAEPPAEAEPPPRASAGRFLTPVKGSVIAGFGPKPGGLHNDGVNIAASRGTPVVAADNGVVAYAGNELRGFGNLLLIRHADGWVTAYAHLERLDVERGAEVKRGQRIGAVGQTGGVPTPQLHFELRKGSQAVDPKGMM